MPFTVNKHRTIKSRHSKDKTALKAPRLSRSQANVFRRVGDTERASLVQKPAQPSDAPLTHGATHDNNLSPPRLPANWSRGLTSPVSSRHSPDPPPRPILPVAANGSWGPAEDPLPVRPGVGNDSLVWRKGLVDYLAVEKFSLSLS